MTTHPATGGWSSSSLVNESNRLKAKECDWQKLAGINDLTTTRTRHNGQGRPNMERHHPAFLARQQVVHLLESSSDSEYMFEDSSSSEEDADAEEDEDKRPPATRVILEVSALDGLMKFCSCPLCGGKLSMSMKTTCIATTITMTCTTRKCRFIHSENPTAPVNVDAVDNRLRNTDFAINILYVVGFLSAGDGGCEAARLLGLLGLANSTTMQTRSFTTIEESIGPALRKVAREMMVENLVAEVKASNSLSPNDLELWERSLTDEDFVLDKCKYPKIQASYDMAWQQRNSGHRYNSASGHGLLVGGLTRKALMMNVKSRLCSICFNWKRKHEDLETEPIPMHYCPKNHDGSSASMEPIACLEMVITMFDRFQVIVQDICIDDDASTRALLRWSNRDWMANNNTTVVPTVAITKGKNKGNPQKRPDKGKLPLHIPEPKFLADPNHRRKVWTGELICLATGNKSTKFTMTKMDATRLGKNYGYMIRSLARLPVEKYEDAGKAVLEHHFDNHAYCGPWCPRKNESDAVRKQKARYYRNRNDKNDAVLYDVLEEKLQRFITLDRLMEVSHGLDTQVNESFNQSASWFAPKNKVYCASMSLTNRLSMAVGINTLGVSEYFQRLFKTLGIYMTDDVLHYLTVKDKARLKRIATSKTKEQKKNRLKRKFEAAVNDEVQAKKERAVRAGTYKPGMNMAAGTVDGYTEDDMKLAAISDNRKSTVRTCPFCKRKGHSTKKSKKCLHYNGGQPTGNPAVAGLPVDEEEHNSTVPIASAARNSLANAVQDMKNFDTYPLMDDPPSDVSLSAYEDADTWSDGEEGIVFQTANL
jgi:hypothetical protein